MTHLALAEGLRVSPTAVLFERAHNGCAVDPVQTETLQAAQRISSIKESWV